MMTIVRNVHAVTREELETIAAALYERGWHFAQEAAIDEPPALAQVDAVRAKIRTALAQEVPCPGSAP